MFAVVRTGGKQYRVAAGDKIAVEKIAGDAGDTISLGDVLLAGEGADLKSTDGLTVSAEIIAQAKGEKVIVFKKRRRHNYRRKNGHRQQYTLLRITAIGDQKPVLSKAEGAPKKAAKTDEVQAEAKSDAVKTEAKAEKPAANPTAAKADPAPKAAAKPAEKAADQEAAKPAAPVKAGATKKAATKKPASDKKS